MNRSMLTLLAAVATGGTAAADTYLTGMAKVVVPAVCAGLLGGLLQAAMPWGTSSWSPRMALKMLFFGAAVGLIAGLLLSHRWFAGLEDTPKIGLEAVAGYLALQILEWVQQLGPKGLAGAILRRIPQAKPPEAM